jgi:hypothetical protein
MDTKPVITAQVLEEERKVFAKGIRTSCKVEWMRPCVERVDMILLLLIRQRQRRQEATPPGVPKRKSWRRTFPSPEVEYAWRHVQQNSTAWYEARAGSSGASSLHRLMGYDDFRTSSCVFLEDSGFVAEPERSIDENLPLDEGHAKEHVGREWTVALMGIIIEETGLWLHPSMPFAHASPDGLVEFPDVKQTLHSCLATAGRLGLWEHKLTLFGLLFNKKGVAFWGFPMKAKPMHVIQMQAQMACVGPEVRWTLYTNLWHFHEASGLKPMPGHGPFNYDEKGQPVDPNDNGGKWAGCWIVASIMISIFWRAPSIINQLYRVLVKHMRTVEKGEQPENVSQLDSEGTFRWCPLLHGVAYLTGSPACVRHAEEIYDPLVIVAHMQSTEERPRGWLGEWPPRILVESRTFSHVQPMDWTLHDMRDC